MSRAIAHRRRWWTGAAALLAACALAGCAPSLDAGPIGLSLDTSGAHASSPTVRVAGLSSDELTALRQAPFSDDEWRALLAISVAGQIGPPIAGRYEAAADALVFHPAFPLDPGRAYEVRFDPRRLPAPRHEPIIVATVVRAAPAAADAARVTAIWPSAATWPENLLRFYVHFSAPMSRTRDVGRVRIEDETGAAVENALLPLGVDLWDHDYTRYTVFFDPGRVKRGLRPNLELGRPLRQGRRYAIVIDGDWRDGHGRALAAPYRHEFMAGPEQTQAIDPRAWMVRAPAAGSRTALDVVVPWPLDRALMRRAIGVASGDGAVAGEIEIDAEDRRWQFTPAAPWAAGGYEIVVLSLLEDAAGNAVGRAFEVELFKKPHAAADEAVRVPFVVDSPRR